MTDVEFFFDLGSPYSYLAYHQLPKIASARGAGIVWRPVLLGGIFKATGNASPIEIPAKGRYTMVDLERWADYWGIPFSINPWFPFNTLTLMRGATGTLLLGAEPFQRYLAAMFHALFGDPRNLNEPAELAWVLERAGLPEARFAELVNAPEVKDRLKADTSEAVERGVFGAPTMFVGREMFWGQDRLLFVDRALAGAP
ncbi:MAG: 2-hydroxychromene-2-carboxylate isomerase [Telmatospirillum sp.]|nr:2-hydroxychromene-2-carboxylate isomerase [Telmatospirillum sp.]